MKIYINQISDTGLELSERWEPSDLDLGREDIKFTQPIEIFARITKGIGVVSVNLKVETEMSLNCSRCLEEIIISKPLEIKLNLPVKNEEVIDITDNLREELILNFPLKPLCRADCRGLCMRCGENLNKGKCRCQKVKAKK